MGQALVGAVGPYGLSWALEGRALVGRPGLLRAGALWDPLGPCGPPAPLWAGPFWDRPSLGPWALVGRALMGPALVPPPCPHGPRP